MPIDHWMVFGTFAEQRHFEYPEVGTYQGVLINANMVAYAPAGLAGFLLEKTAGKMKYIVDPLTHAFQHDPAAVCDEEGEPKSSIKALAGHYGEPMNSRVGRSPLRPDDLREPSTLREFTRRCLRYQRDHLRAYMAESDAAKYLDTSDVDVPPYAVVAPYFFLTETGYSHWLTLCIDAARLARDLAGQSSPSKLFASVVVSRGILVDGEALEQIQAAYNDVDLDGFLLWVDDLDEQTASRAELRGLLRLARDLRGAKKNREVINLHGGYFSVLAAGSAGSGAFSGVAHGPEFGEFRGVVPVGGGIPIARYYVPKLHARIRYRDALRMFHAKRWLESASVFHSNVCLCAECKNVLAGDASRFALFGEGTVKSVRRRHGIVRIEFPTGETKLRCLRHYLQRKRLEYEAAASNTRDNLLNDLEAGATEYEDVAGLEGVAHLRLWKGLFQGMTASSGRRGD